MTKHKNKKQTVINFLCENALATHQDSAEESSQRRFSASWEVPSDYVCTLKMSQDKHSSRHEEKKSGKICHPVVVMQIQSAPPDVCFSAPLSPVKAC